MGTLLKVTDLVTHFYIGGNTIKAVDGVSLELDEGKTLGVVGESGCGKSVTFLSVMRLLPKQARIVSGSIRFDGRDLTLISEEQMRSIRGSKISMIFQEPMTSLNPVYTIGNQIAEAIVLHQGLSYSAAMQKAVELLRICKVPDPEARVNEYPHRLSGGMRQRAMIAMALSCNPKLLIADEPTTALDVTVQAQILKLLKDLQKEFGMSIIIISHDLSVIYEMADYVAVMYAGKVVEYAPKDALFKIPRHPYTTALYRSRPAAAIDKKARLYSIAGDVPSPLDFPPGCRFHTRCRYVQDKCRIEVPSLDAVGESHKAACFFPLSEALDG